MRRRSSGAKAIDPSSDGPFPRYDGETCGAQYANIRRFRTTLYIGFVVVALLDFALIFEPSADPWLPICGSEMLGEGASCAPVWRIEAVGLFGGVLAAGVALLRIPVTHEPYNLKRAQNPGQTAAQRSDSTGRRDAPAVERDRGPRAPALPDVLVYAVIFGYSQQLVTRLIDRKAKSLVTAQPKDTSVTRLTRGGAP
jgi:hypothetical protein